MPYLAFKQFPRLFRQKSKYGPHIDSAIIRVYKGQGTFSEESLVKTLLEISERKEAQMATEVRFNILGRNGPFTRTVTLRIFPQSEEELLLRIKEILASYSSAVSGSKSLVDLDGLELDPRSFSVTFLYGKSP